MLTRIIWRVQGSLLGENHSTSSASLELNAVAEVFDECITNLVGRDVLLLCKMKNRNTLTRIESRLDQFANFITDCCVHQVLRVVRGGWVRNGSVIAVHGCILPFFSFVVKGFFRMEAHLDRLVEQPLAWLHSQD